MPWSSTDFSSFSGSQNKKQAALCGLWQVERIFCLSGKQNLCSSLTQYLGAYCYSSTTSLRAFQSIQMSLLWHEMLKTEKRENKELKPRSVQSNMGSLMKQKWISCLDGLIQDFSGKVKLHLCDSCSSKNRVLNKNTLVLLAWINYSQFKASLCFEVITSHSQTTAEKQVTSFWILHSRVLRHCA